MNHRLYKLPARLALCALALLPGSGTLAAELGDFCWLTDSGKLLRFSVTQSGTTHYTYTGNFDDGDGVGYDIIGQASTVGSSIKGSFSGSLSTAGVFKTGIFHVTINPVTLAATIEGIREAYVQGADPNTGVTTSYRTHAASATPCP
jgi:hypothetical protein